MKKHILYIAVGIMVMLMATSCEKDGVNNIPIGEGGISLSLSVNNDVTRADLSDDVINNAQVKIYKPNYLGLIREYVYSDVPDVIYLPATSDEGKYRVDIFAGERVKENPAKASWDSKSYKGSAEFAVVANEVAESAIEVVANICNVVTQVSFDQSVTDAFESSYGLTVGYDNNTLTYAAADNGKDGYFIIADDAYQPEFTWNFVGNLQKDGSEFKSSGKFIVEQGKRYVMKLKYVEKDGTLKFVVQVDKTLSVENDQITFVPTSTGISTTKKYDIWATHITLRADVDEAEYDGSKVYFEYRKANTEGTWSSVIATKESEGVYAKVIAGLEPDTEYECRLIVTPNGSDIAADPIAGKNFTTALAQQVPNASFEHAYDHSDGYKIFNPSEYSFPTSGAANEPGSKHTWWGTGNQNAYVTIVNVTQWSNDVPHTEDGNAHSVCMKSDYVVVKFAAGNIYSGYFDHLEGTKGGEVHFGRRYVDDSGNEFISRPTGVSFYVKYESKQITEDCANGGGLGKDDWDEGQVKFAVGNWDEKECGGSKDCPVAINTLDSSKNPLPAEWNLATLNGTIAYRDMIFTKTEHSDKGWMKVTLKFNYNTMTAIPTHILISAASSRLGDYFTGGKGSTMYLDDIKLLYDYGVEDEVKFLNQN